MPFETIRLETKIDNVRVVDVRTDAITKPTEAMRKIMGLAEVGDSAFGEDPTVCKLERRCAELLGKEDAIYLPSGTMCNLISIMVHCNRRGMEFIAGDKSHAYLYEQGGSAILAGVQCALVEDLPNGTFCLEDVERKLRIDTDCHQLSTGLIIVENTHNICGGKVIPLDWLDSLVELARKYNLPVHMDGARLMNAVVQSGISAKRFARDMDSVFFCLSKGLACPMGSVLCGTTKFIDGAKRLRKMLGGGVRQVGILASAGLLALDEMVDRLQVDHDHTYQIGKAIDDLGSDIFKVDLSTVQTNILLIQIDRNVIKAIEFLQKLFDVKETDEVKVCVRAGAVHPGLVRLVLHCEITDEDVQQAINKIQMVIKQVHHNVKSNSIKTI